MRLADYIVWYLRICPVHSRACRTTLDKYCEKKNRSAICFGIQNVLVPSRNNKQNSSHVVEEEPLQAELANIQTVNKK